MKALGVLNLEVLIPPTEILRFVLSVHSSKLSVLSPMFDLLSSEF
jgi:hypothetical protein